GCGGVGASFDLTPWTCEGAKHGTPCAGHALRNARARKESGLHGGGGPYAGPRLWCEHGHFQRGAKRPPATASLSGTWAAGRNLEHLSAASAARRIVTRRLRG